ncbi:MAG: twitch domain-containing radical SAM protein [Planctomycetota bacterium]
MDAEIIAKYDAARDFTNKPFRSACYAPFTSMVFDSIGRVRICCANFEYIVGDIRSERLDAIWNGERMNQLRDALRSYDFRLGCGFCHWKISVGDFEGKTLMNSSLMTMKYESFPVESAPPYWPKHLEFHLSNVCNLECVTCFGEFSSLIRAKREGLPPIACAYDDQFFADLRKYLPHLEFAQFLGGEPFIIPEMHRVWDMLIEDGLTPNCHITTNGTVFSDRVERVLTHLPVSINVSADGATKETFESIRTNAKFEKVMRNFRRFRDFIGEKGTVQFNFTLSRLNCHEFVDFLVMAESERAPVSVSDLFEPKEYSLFMLPPEELARVVDQMEKRMSEVESSLGRNRSVLVNRLGELRHRLRHGDERMFFEERASVVGTFRRVADRAVSPDELSATARGVLREWSHGGEVDSFSTDAADIITQGSFHPNGLFPDSPSLVGQTVDDFFGRLKEAFGDQVTQIKVDTLPDYIDRVVGFEDASRTRTVIRSFVIPRYESGVLAGAEVLLARLPHSDLVVLS